MLFRTFNYLLRNKTLVRQIKRNVGHSGHPKETGALFFNEEVQDLLKKLTRPEVEKVFRRRKDGGTLEPPTYKFMTTKELDEARKEAEKRLEKKLQMPPVLEPREEENYVFVKDERLQGYCDSKFVFTDITFGTADRTRTIVVREPDGTLRKAKLEERSRMNELYFPRRGRKYKVPQMFHDPYLQSLLDRGEFEFVLERACAQFEPDDSLYLAVVERAYGAVDSSKSYNTLRSTRHFGPLVFHLAQRSQIDNLLLENLQTDRLEDAVWLVSLYHILNPKSKSRTTKYRPGYDLDFIKAYIEQDSSQKEVLELAFNTYKDLLSSPKSQNLMEAQQ